MTLSEANWILLIETLEKDDLNDPFLADKYIDLAKRRDYSANFISDPVYSDMARSLAAWNRKVAEAIKVMQGHR